MPKVPAIKRARRFPLEWNARNQLTGINRTGLTASFTYDSFGRRTGRTVNGTVTNYVYDGFNPGQEKNGATVTANLTGLNLSRLMKGEERTPALVLNRRGGDERSPPLGAGTLCLSC
jgi:YD repeat-containing protein